MKNTSALSEAWPLLATLRALGWISAERCDGSDVLRMSTRYKIHSAIALSIQLVPALYIVIKGFTLVSSLDPNLELISYVQLISGILAPQFMSFFASIQSPGHVNLWNQFHKLQVGIKRTSLSQEPFKFTIVRRIAIITIFNTTLPVIMIMIILPLILQTTPTWTFDLYIALSVSNMQLLVGWWITVTTIMQVLSQRLVDNFKILCEYNESGKTGVLVGILALEMRPLWLQLCYLVRTLGNVLSISLSIHLLNSFAFMVYVMYQLLSKQSLSITIFYVTIAVMGLGMIYVLCSCAQTIQRKVHADLIDAIKITKEFRTSLDIRKQLISFFAHIRKQSPRSNLSGYIFLDNKLVSSLIVALITNMLVLYQLQIHERKLELQDIFTFGEGDIL